jgi:hypothetical protein
MSHPVASTQRTVAPTGQPSAARSWRHGGRGHLTAKIPRASFPLAETIGCQPKTAAHYLAKIGFLATAAIHAYQRSGDQVGLARLLHQVDAARAGIPSLPLTDALERTAVQAAHEHVEAIVAYAQEPNVANRRQLLRSIDRECAELLQFRGAVLRAGDGV